MTSSSSPSRARLTIYTVGKTRLVGAFRPRGAAGDRVGTKPRLPGLPTGTSVRSVRTVGGAPRGATSLKRPRPSFVA